jgi:sec-independent protein translocase protein TatB
MFNLGFSELLVIGVIALIFIGPKELPEIARVVGRMLNELKRATGDLSATILEPKQRLEQELRNTIDKIQEDVLDPNHKGDDVDGLYADKDPELPEGRKDEPKS